MVKTERAGSDLRDGILCKRKILHQHIQAFVVFIQELSHPPEERQKQVQLNKGTQTSIKSCGQFLSRVPQQFEQEPAAVIPISDFKGDIPCSFLRSIILFWVWKRFTCFSVQKTHLLSHTVQCCSTVFPFCLKCSVLASVPLRPPPEYLVCSDWSAHTRLSQHH